jgi:tripartite-type tricarboxylate transporter receptor subunit TctC
MDRRERRRPGFHIAFEPETYMLRKFIHVLACAVALAAPLAHAEESYPARPIHLIVPFAPGGSTDVLARLMSRELQGELGQNVIVENKPGAGGNIGGDFVAKAAPDGYTVLMAAAGPTVINPSLYSKMPYSPTKDLRPVTQLINEANVMVVNPKVPAKTVQEFIAYAKANPNKISFGSPGNGSPAHLAGELFNQITGTKMTHVPYKGSGPAINDLLTGQIQVMIDNMPPLWPYVQSGQLRALGVSTAKRWPAAPELPTIEESGVPGFVITAWKGMMVPAGTPDAIVNRLHDAAVKILAKPEFRKRLQDLGAEPLGSTPEQFAAVIKQETASWGKLVKSTGARVD